MVYTTVIFFVGCLTYIGLKIIEITKPYKKPMQNCVSIKLHQTILGRLSEYSRRLVPITPIANEKQKIEFRTKKTLLKS